MTRHVPNRSFARPLLSGLLVGCALVVPALVFTRVDTTISAVWRDAEVVVDGSIAGWPNLARVDNGPAVAVQNDDTALYVAIATNDVTVREQLATGLIVWLDGSARKAQTFGLRLEGLAPRPPAGAAPAASVNGQFDRDLNTLDAFDLLGPARLQRRLIDNPADLGIALASGVEDGTVVYELRVPLERTAGTPHAVGVKPGAMITLGLETPADPRPSTRRNRLDDPMNTNPWVVNPYGYGGYFNPPPPPAPGSSSRPKEVVFKPMKLIWAQVRLAVAPKAGAGLPRS